MTRPVARTLITIPRTPKEGEVIEIRVLIQHPMETGFRVAADGQLLPRDIIKRFTCRFDDGSGEVTIFAAELFPAIAANPYLAFDMVAANGTFAFAWEGDNGFAHAETAVLKVS
jgi:sulfur-oxidizing protein SoxZ